MQTASRPCQASGLATRQVKRPGIFWAFLLFSLLAPVAQLLAQTGTADGTYNFANVSTTAGSGGTGFKTQEDKFVVSDIFKNDLSPNQNLMFANNATQGAAQSVVLKANNTVIKTFTLKNLSVSNFGTTTFALAQFDITLKDYFGNTIASHSLAGNQSFTNAGPSIASFNFSTPWPANGYNLVNSVEITFRYATATVRPSNMNWNNWTLANMSNATPTSVTVGTISGSPFCAGASVSVPYTASGINSGNTFTAQLSDASGSFASPTSIGTLTSTSSGTISATIPTSTASGTGYRIRVVANNPSYTSSDNGSNLTINAKPSASISSFANVSCFNGSNGSVTVSASGGTPSYSYSWSPSGGAGATASGLAQGTYTVTVSDSKGCQATASKTLTQPSAPVSGSTVVTNVACFGGSNGAINLTPSGGTPGYTFLWNNGTTTTEDRTGLVSGTYSVTITDANGCTGSVSNISVSQPSAAVGGTTVVTNVACFGGNTGAINLTPTGGTAGFYTFNWGGGITTEDRTGLAAGTYSVIITDINGCTGTVSNISVSQPSAPVSGTTVVTNVACFGGNTGAINLTPTGGVGGYTYLWANGGATTEDRTSLSAGTYSVTITDNNGCTGTVSNISVAQPSAPVSGTTVVTNVACFGGNTGAINLTPTGGTPGYTFLWNNGTSTTEDRTSLSAGTYSVTITDANGCTGTVSNISVSQPSAPVSGTTVVTNVACFGGNTGAINLTPTGGVGGYTYLWANGGATTEDRTNLSAGTYSVTITDNNGCTGTVSNISVAQPSAPVSGSTVLTNPSCFGSSNGSINLTPSGGTSPYTFLWNDGITTTEDRSGLPAGTYSVTITDANGCQATLGNLSLSQPSQLTIDPVSNQVVCHGHNTTAIAFTGNASSYEWTNDNTSIGLSASGSGDMSAFTAQNSGSTAVVATITVTPVNAGCSGPSTSFTITVNPAPSATISYDGSPYFTGSGTASVTQTGTGGGTYSSTAGIALNAATGEVDLTTSTPGSYTVTYTVAAAGGCDVFSTSAPIVLVNPFSATIAYEGSPYCNSTGTASVTRTGTAGGTYSATPAGLSIDATTGAIDLALSTPGTYTVKYGTTPTDFTTTQVAIRPTTFINSEPNGVICDGSTYGPVTFTGAPGLSFTWSAGNTAIGIPASGSGTIPAFTATNPGNTSIASYVYVEATGGTGCDLKRNMIFRITVNPTPVITAVSNQVLCAGSNTAPVNFSSSVAGTTISWTNNNTAIGLHASGTGSIPSFNAVNNTGVLQTATIGTSAVADGCVSAPTSFTIAVSPSAGSIAYPGSPYCQVGPAVPNRTGSTGGVFTASPAGLDLNAATGSINLGASTPGTYIVTYTVAASGGCNATASASITINPQAFVNNIGNQVYCNGVVTAPVPFSGNAPSYTWTNSNPSIGLAASGSGTSLPSFTTMNAGPGVQYAYVRVTPQGNGSTTCPGRGFTFRIAVNYCGPITVAGDHSGDGATARTAMMQQFEVGPNPARSTVVLQYKGSEQGPFTVQIVSQYGTAVGKTATMSGNTHTLDLSGVTPGSYLLQVTHIKTGITFNKQLIKL